MAHFAKLDEQNNVIEVHCLHNNELLVDGVENEQKGIDFLVNWSGGYPHWKQTSYNGNIRKNYAGVGYTYDTGRDAFIAPKPYPSWVLDDVTCQWGAPVAYPTDNKQYRWDETTTAWVEIPYPSPYPSWVKNETTGRWEAPIPIPNDGKKYSWDEPTLSWVEVV